MRGDQSVPGIYVNSVASWFSKHVPGAQPPLQFSIIPGGHSNLTYLVTDTGGRRFVLRRPPLALLRPSAHDVGRECKAMSALAGTQIPVPEIFGYCTDRSVTGAPFYVMRFVEGWVPRDGHQVERFLSPDRRGALGLSLAKTLGNLHALHPGKVGLSDLGHGQGYVDRQIRRWVSQWESWKTRDVEGIDRLHDWLKKRIPERYSTTIVHGDFRLDNTVIGYDDGRIRAVLDWELCTLGDPLADLAMTVAYWVEPKEDPLPHLSSATVLPGFPTRREITEAYAMASGRDVSTLDFYLALAYWKIAIILEGVYSRYLSGAFGEYHENLGDQIEAVDGLIEKAEYAAARLGYGG